VHDWAEVHRLHEREGWSKTAIARRLHMSRNTVDRLLRLSEPPRYERRATGSLLDPLKPDIAEMLESDAEAPATVILDHLHARGYAGRITILGSVQSGGSAAIDHRCRRKDSQSRPWRSIPASSRGDLPLPRHESVKRLKR
jgi:hypothetical protein